MRAQIFSNPVRAYTCVIEVQCNINSVLADAESLGDQASASGRAMLRHRSIATEK
jgi:hypothetical protein